MNRPLPNDQLLNGHDLRVVEALGAQIAAAPDGVRVAFPVTAKWEGAARVQSHAAGFELAGAQVERPHTLVIDEPVELLGHDTGPNPQQLLLSALAACLSITFVDHATMGGIAVTSLEVDVRGELDLRGVMGLDPDVVPGFAGLHCVVRVKAEASQSELEELLASARQLSPTFWQLSRCTPIDVALVVEEA